MEWMDYRFIVCFELLLLTLQTESNPHPVLFLAGCSWC